MKKSQKTKTKTKTKVDNKSNKKRMSKKVTGEDWIVESIKDVPFEDLYEWGLQLGSGATAKVSI